MAPQNADNIVPENGAIDKEDSSIRFGKILANPPTGEEVTISGISGRFPDSEDVYQFRDNLFNKVDMVTADDRRWKLDHPEIPRRSGKITNIEKMDAGYFGLHHRQANAADPPLRMLLEKVTEALFDAGIHPADLEGTNTGVFVGVSFSESESIWFSEKLIPNTFAITGCERSMLANRISYFFKLKGPSFICDTACSSSLFAFEHAYKAIRTGKCEKAIVAGTNLTLHPYVSLQFARLGVLSKDGRCKVFDEAADGYARSEAVAAIILQKSKDSKRIYSYVLHVKSNSDGYKDSGITYPSGEMQTHLLQEFYEECDSIKPTDLSFLEAHGTGTKVGDPAELQSIEEIFLEGRKTPLLIGSVKSNIGHTEPASGLCSITKAIIAFETSYIPPNLHYQTPRSDNISLNNGCLKVVTEKTPFMDNRGLIGISNFGFGGSNCHVLLKHNPKAKINNGIPADNISRLVCVSGRTEEAINVLLDDVCKNNIDVEHIGLLQELFRKSVPNHLYRGYSLVSKFGEISRSIENIVPNKPDLIVCFGVIDKSIRDKAKEYLEVPLFAKTIHSIHQILQTKAFDIISTLQKTNNANILETLLVNLSLQIAFADILKSLQIRPTNIFGVTKDLSLGTLVCAYYDGALTLKEIIDCCYAIAQAMSLYTAESGSDSECLDSLFIGNKTFCTLLQQNLAKILGKPRRLSKNIIFEFSPADISSIHLTNSFGSLKVLEEVKGILGKRVTIFEIGNGSIIELLKKKSNHVIEKLSLNQMQGLDKFLICVGRLYELGFEPQICNLYPEVKFPVSRGTPMISPKIKWNHMMDWYVLKFNSVEKLEWRQKTFSFLLNEPSHTFLEGHNIDGRILFPAAGYLSLVWETLASIYGRSVSDTRIMFENCKFRRACAVPQDNPTLNLLVMIQRGSGDFEVTEGNVPVVTGRVTLVEDNETQLVPVNLPTGVSKSIMQPMTSKDIYKELRLRGYNYNGEFRGLESCDQSAQVGQIKWTGNWITFIDNLLQMKILQEDTRLLYVPTSIRRLTIDAPKHIACVEESGEHSLLQVSAPRNYGLIRSGAVEIRGLIASSIARRKYRGTPVLEKYIFVPSFSQLKTEEAVRANIQILLENVPSIKVKVVEVIDEATSPELQPLGDMIHDALADLPLIQPDITILTKTNPNVKKVKIGNRTLQTELECSLVVASQIFQRTTIFKLALGCLKPNAFILSRESLDFDVRSCSNEDVTIITSFTTEQEQLILARKTIKSKTPVLVEISSGDQTFTWLPKLKSALQKTEDILVYTQTGTTNGALGMINCLRQEPGGQKVRILFIADSAPKFDLDLPFYKDQLQKNLAVNIYKEGHWGSYRHLLLEPQKKVNVEHCYVNSLVRGDLSSLAWIEGPLNANSHMNAETSLVSVYYAALNFRDVMTASGKINVDSITRDRREQECVQGFEFSGRTQDGKRVMGLTINGACASLLAQRMFMSWDVPEHWTLKDAATVPCVYLTCIYALFKEGQMKRGQTVLIHSGTGGIGQAAITLALHKGCTVYTTVGTKEKREFLKKTFPQILDEQIASSRDTNFEKHIMNITKGRGVDIVLNSLAEEKLTASVRCLARGGRFIEIGKFDLANDNTLNLLLLERSASFHGVMLDGVFKQPEQLTLPSITFSELIKSGAIRPLANTTFQMTQVEDAFRFMSTGKHMGKVLIEVRQEEKEKYMKPTCQMYSGSPRYYCDSNKTYIICGGLGGFGLELADWLALRNCKKIVLVSRSGIKTGYQAYRIAIWRSYGCTIKISTDDITTVEGCQNLIRTANELGPVGAVFNLAVVLQDAILENQTAASFQTSFKPKAYATHYLDEVTRKLCPELRDFVVFSSVSCGRGNAGQTNYGMANSVMEKICEKRRKDGFPALAIEWGAVGDVGLVAELQDNAVELEIGGTLQQRISNCLQVMDILLRQDESAIVSSMVVAEKRAGLAGDDSIVDTVANILGIKDLKAISLQSTLAEVGMDSMTAVEIKQTLEREFEVFLTPQDIKAMTFGRLIEIEGDRNAGNTAGIKDKSALDGMHVIIRFNFEESTMKNLPLLSIKRPVSNDQILPTCMLFPGIEGNGTVLEPLYKNFEADLIVLQFPNNGQKDSIEEMASACVSLIEERISKSRPFIIVSYSYGGLVALESVRILEEKGHQGTLICIDSSPDYLKALLGPLEVDDEDKFQVSLIAHLMSMYMSHEVIASHLDALTQCNTLEERINLGRNIIGEGFPYTPEFTRMFTISIYNRLKAFVNWNPMFKLKSKVILFKSTVVVTDTKLADEDYGLSKLCQNPVEVREFEGNHVTILANPEVGLKINDILLNFPYVQ